MNALSVAGYDRYYNKYINVKKGSIAGVNMVLACYVLFNYCRCYKELSECLPPLSHEVMAWAQLGMAGHLSS